MDNDSANDVMTNDVTLPINDFLKKGGNIPTFLVWTGIRYRFDANGNVQLTNPSPCNSRFQVQISNDPTFRAGATIVSPFVTVSTNPTAQSSTQCFGTFLSGS